MSFSETYDEKELLLRIAEGDEQMFALFFRQKSPLLLHWIRRLIRDEAGSLEVLQDVLVQIWQHIHPLRLPACGQRTIYLHFVCFGSLICQLSTYQPLPMNKTDIEYYIKGYLNNTLTENERLTFFNEVIIEENRELYMEAVASLLEDTPALDPFDEKLWPLFNRVVQADKPFLHQSTADKPVNHRVHFPN